MSERIDLDELDKALKEDSERVCVQSKKVVGGLIDRIRELERALESAECDLNTAGFQGACDQARHFLRKGAVRRG